MKVLCKKNESNGYKKGEYYTIEKDFPESCIIILHKKTGYRFYYSDYFGNTGLNIFEDWFIDVKELRRDKLKKLQNI